MISDWFIPYTRANVQKSSIHKYCTNQTFALPQVPFQVTSRYVENKFEARELALSEKQDQQIEGRACTSLYLGN